MWVVKLGGSLACSSKLVKCLEVFHKFRKKINFVIIPGGGVFADQIRFLQKKINFNDNLAHQLATLSTEQYGFFLLSKCKKLKLADDVDSVKAAFRRHEVPILLSSRMLLNARDIRRDWNFTSDSISAWFCRRIGAKNLILLKSANIKKFSETGENLRLSTLQKNNIIDRYFGVYAKRARLSAYYLKLTDWEKLTLNDFKRKRLGLNINLND